MSLRLSESEHLQIFGRPKRQPMPSDNSRITAALEHLAQAVLNQKPAQINVPEPKVIVQPAPTLEPVPLACEPSSPHEWTFDIVRDDYGRISQIKATPL